MSLSAFLRDRKLKKEDANMANAADIKVTKADEKNGVPSQGFWDSFVSGMEYAPPIDKITESIEELNAYKTYYAKAIADGAKEYCEKIKKKFDEKKEELKKELEEAKEKIKEKCGIADKMKAEADAAKGPFKDLVDAMSKGDIEGIVKACANLLLGPYYKVLNFITKMSEIAGKLAAYETKRIEALVQALNDLADISLPEMPTEWPKPEFNKGDIEEESETRKAMNEKLDDDAEKEAKKIEEFSDDKSVPSV